MSAPCVCWDQPASLHDGHCCMFDGTAVVPSCHPERASGRPACGCLSWLDRMDSRRCEHDDRDGTGAGRLVFGEPETLDCQGCGAYPSSRHRPDCPRMLARFSRVGEDDR